ncbi:MAG: diguanylate cyclase [Candidatus Limnocylindria bacterium]
MAGRSATKPKPPSEVRFHADKDGCLAGPGFVGAVTAQLKALKEGGEETASLLQLDLDGLHQVNTGAGREAGDRLLAAAIATLARNARSEGWTFGRLGGDEFALFAPGLPLEAAFLRADRLRQEVDAALAKVAAHGHRCTVSVGVANLPRDARSPDELLRKADLALYAAKDQGGDAAALVPGGEMVLRSSYYGVAQLSRLRSLAERLKKKESVLLREGLDDLLRKYDRS